jgi:hypothetical protein
MIRLNGYGYVRDWLVRVRVRVRVRVGVIPVVSLVILSPQAKN